MFNPEKIANNELTDIEKKHKLEQIIQDLKSLGYDDLIPSLEEKINSFDLHNEDRISAPEAETHDPETTITETPEIKEEVRGMEEFAENKKNNIVFIRDQQGSELQGELETDGRIINIRKGDEKFDLEEWLSYLDELAEERPEDKEFILKRKEAYRLSAQKAVEEKKEQNETIDRIMEITKSLMMYKEQVMEELRKGGRDKYNIFLSPEHFEGEATNHKDLFRHLYSLAGSVNSQKNLEELESLLSNSR